MKGFVIGVSRYILNYCKKRGMINISQLCNYAA